MRRVSRLQALERAHDGRPVAEGADRGQDKVVPPRLRREVSFLAPSCCTSGLRVQVIISEYNSEIKESQTPDICYLIQR